MKLPIIPTIQQVEEIVRQKKYLVDPDYFMDWYESLNWEIKDEGHTR